MNFENEWDRDNFPVTSSAGQYLAIELKIKVKKTLPK
jgi:hypothetical protein